MGNLDGFGVVGPEVLNFSLQGGIVLYLQGPVYQVGKLHAFCEQQFIFRGDGSMVVPNWVSMEGTRVDHTATAVSSKKFGKGSMEIVGDEGGDDVLFAIWDDKKVTSAGSIKVVLPPRTWVNAWLRTTGAWGISLASASMALASNALVLICWYRTMAIGEIGEREWDGTSLMNASIMGKV